MAEKKKKEKKQPTTLEAPKTEKFTSVADEVFEIDKAIKENEENKGKLKEKLIKLTTVIRKKEMAKRFIKSVKVFGKKERHLLMEFKNSFFKYNITEVKVLKEIFKGHYKSLFDEVRDIIIFNKGITQKELKQFFGEDKEKFNEFKKLFISNTDSYVKPNNKFQEKAFELKKEFTKKQNERAKEIYEDATHSITMKINP